MKEETLKKICGLLNEIADEARKGDAYDLISVRAQPWCREMEAHVHPHVYKSIFGDSGKHEEDRYSRTIHTTVNFVKVFAIIKNQVPQ